MNIKTIAKMAVGVVGMGVAYVISGKCGDFAKEAFDNRNNNNDNHEGEMLVVMEPEDEISDENED